MPEIMNYPLACRVAPCYFMNMNIFLVGGAVRNLLLGRKVVDKDFLVNGISREAFIKQFPKAKEVGKSFPVFLVDGDEYSFLRSDSFENDLLERDFTINALAVDENGTLYAHPKGLEDLHQRKLDICSENSFNIDPLRVFRAARFLSELSDFTPSDRLVEKMRHCSANGLTAQVSAERVGKELLRALDGDRPSRFLEMLHMTHSLRPWFAEYETADAKAAGPLPHHDQSILGHTLQVMDRLAGQTPLRVWMGMVHDIGKCTTATEDLPRHIGHEDRGEQLALKLAKRLRLSNVFMKAGAHAARWHMMAGRYPELRASTKVKLLTRLNSRDAVADLFAVSQADTGGRDDGPRALADFERITSVHLPPQFQNNGLQSGEILHQMRCEAIKQNESHQ